MKKSTVAQKMRWTAGILYLVLCVYQMAAANTVLLAGSPTQTFTWLAIALVIPAAGAMAIWMFSGNNVFSAGVRRSVVVGTIWFVAFELLTYSEQIKVINYTLSSYSFVQGLADNNIALYAFVIIRLLLMILAAFFVTSARDSLDYVGEKSAREGEAASAAPAAKPGEAAASADLDKPLDVARKEEPKKEVFKHQEKPEAKAENKAAEKPAGKPEEKPAAAADKPAQ